MGSAWGLGRFCLVLALLLFSSALQATSGFVRKVEELDEKAYQLKAELIQSSGKNSGELLRRAKQALSVLENDLDPSFPKELETRLARFHSPSSATLQTIKNELVADMASIEATSGKKDTLFQDEPGELTIAKINPVVFPMLQAFISTGDREPVVDLFELLSAYVVMANDYLIYKHIETIASAESPTYMVKWEGFLKIHESLEYALTVHRTFFPTLPDFSFGKLSDRKKMAEAVDPFINSFADSAGLLPQEQGQRLAEALGRLVRAQGHVEMYRLIFYPRMAEDAVLHHLMQSIFNVPGAEDCLNLAKGVSSFDSVACRPATFKKQLEAFIDEFHKNGDHAVAQLMQTYIVEYQQGLYGELSTETGKNEAFETLTSKLAAIAQGDTTETIKNSWPKVMQHLQSAQPKNLRRLLETGGSGLEIFDLIKSALNQNGIDLRNDMNRLGEGGTIEDFTPDIAAVEVLKDDFVNAVEEPLLMARLEALPETRGVFEKKVSAYSQRYQRSATEFERKKMRRESALEVLEQKTERFDATEDSCAIFRSDMTDPEKAQSAPYVIVADRLADRLPHSKDGANAGRQMRFYHQAHFANAQTIQNTDRPEKMFAGVAVRTAVGLIVPNVVHARMMMTPQLGEPTGADISDFGIATNEKSLLNVSEEKYLFADYSSVIVASRLAFKEMIRHYADRKGLLDIPNAKEMDPIALDTAIKAKFEADYFAIVMKYQNEHRAEMKRAAEKIRKWDGKIKQAEKELASGRVTSGPSLFEELIDFQVRLNGGDEKTRAGAREYARRKLKDLNPKAESSILYMVDDLKLHHVEMQLRKDYPEKKNSEIQAIAKSIDLSRVQPSTAELVAQFRVFGLKWVGPDLFKDFMGQPGGAGLFDRRVLPALFDYLMNLRDRKLDTMRIAKTMLLYRFPALKLKVKALRSSQEAWEVFQGSLQEYQHVMKAYLDNAVAQANRYQKLGDNADDEMAQAKLILDEVMLNLPLLDVILRFFPDQKAFVCTERAKRNLSEASYDRYLRAANATGGLVCFAGFLGVCWAIPGGQVVAAVGTVIYLVCALAESYHYYKKLKQVERVRNFEMASSGQMGLEGSVRNIDAVREMQKTADAVFWSMTLEWGFTALSLIPAKPGIAGASKSFTTTVRAAGGPTAYLLSMPMRLFNSGKAGLTALRHWKFVGTWSEVGIMTPRLRLMHALTDPVSDFAGPAFLLEKAGHFVYHGVGFIKDIYVHLPWSFVGRGWMNTRRAFAIQAPFMAGQFVGTGLYLYRSVEEAAMGNVMRSLYRQPEDYEDLVARVRAGELGHGDLWGIMKCDQELSKRVMEAAQKEQTTINQIMEWGAQDEADAQTLENARKNLTTIYLEMTKELENYERAGKRKNAMYTALLRRTSELRGMLRESGVPVNQ